MSTHHHHSPHTRRRRATDPATLERAAALFRALADTPRLQIVEALATGERCVSELADEGTGMSTISARLRVLLAERLVTRRREGKHVYYALADDHVAALVAAAVAHAHEREPSTVTPKRKELSLPRSVRKNKRSPR